MPVFDLTRLLGRVGSAAATQPAAAEPGTVIGRTERDTPVVWPLPSSKAGHVAVLAASGAGKTVLVAHALATEFVAAVTASPETEQPSIVVVDPKNDLTTGVCQALAAADPALLARVTVLDPFSASGFPFNLCHLPLGATPLDIRADQLTSLVAEMSTSGAGVKIGIGARQRELLLHATLASLACEHESRNILWALDALQLPDGLKLLARCTTSQRAKMMLSTAEPSDELKASCASRLRSAFAASEQLERLVTPPTCVSFSELLQPGRIVLVPLGSPPGGLVQLTEFWANLIIRLLVEHLMERPSPWRGHHVRIVVDEAQVVAPALSDVAERVLTVARSRGLSFIALTQGTTLLNAASPTLLRVLATNAPLKIIGRLAAPDAELLSRELAPGKGSDESSGAVRSRFTASVTNLEDREFFALRPGSRERFSAAHVDMCAWHEAAERHSDAIAALEARMALPAPSPRATLAVAQPQKRRTPDQPARERGRKGGRWA